MAEIGLTYEISETSNDDGDTLYVLQGYVSSTSGFTVDPGKNVLMAMISPAGDIYHYRVCLCSDMYNYPDNAADSEIHYFRRHWFNKTFERVYQAKEFVDNLQSDLNILAKDWEQINIARQFALTESFDGGELYVWQKTAVSSSLVLEDKSKVGYFLLTIKAVMDAMPVGSASPSPSPSFDIEGDSVFVLSDSNNAWLERIATYDDIQNKTEGGSPGERTDEITVCVNSDEKRNEIVAAMKADLVKLNADLEFIYS